MWIMECPEMLKEVLNLLAEARAEFVGSLRGLKFAIKSPVTVMYDKYL